MYLSEVKFEAFKSLYDVECQLDKFTVITGPNGAGKSNLVDALNFIGEVYADGLEFAVGRGGGYDNIAHRRTRRATRPVAVSIKANISAEEIERYSKMISGGSDESDSLPTGTFLEYEHQFALGTTSQSVFSDYEVKRDIITIRLNGVDDLVMLANEGDSALSVVVSNSRKLHSLRAVRDVLSPLYDKKYLSYIRGSSRVLSVTSVLSERLMYDSYIFGLVRRAIAGTRVFQLSPFQCRTPGVATPNAVLSRHGENLPAAADHLRRNDSHAWSQVQSAMRSVLPQLQEIEVKYTEDRHLALQFRERGVGRSWSTGEVSDGTVQALALLIALYDQRSPVLVVEEPENSLHPWILRNFIDLCREVENKQIIVTTHSPVLLNYVDPKIVRLMTMRHGRSRIDRLLDLSENLRSNILSGEISLFDAYDSGVIPLAVPRGLGVDPVGPSKGGNE